MAPPISYLIVSTLIILISLLPTLSLSQPTPQPQLTASLDYGTFRGAYSTKYNITYYQKIPFAAPPTGQNRFRAPQPPLPIKNGTYDSSQTFDMCPQRTVNGSEDCLYLGLYSRPWTPSQPLRPVIVVFYGGGFIQGSASFSLPPSAYPILNVSSAENDMIFVYPNYRVNAFGFLPGREVGRDAYSDTNVGLLDQRAVLEWTRKYIGVFGGDKGNVAVWGQSAGGGSVVAQVIADADFKGSGSSSGGGGGGEGERKKEKLFNKALASSPFWPKTYRYDSPEAQWQYDTLVNKTGCSSAKDTLSCLKGLDVQVIRTASLNMTTSHQYTTSSFTWGPVLDDDFLTKPLSSATLHRGEDVDIDYGFGMYNEFEGENFIPPGLSSPTSDSMGFNSSEAGFEFWLRGFLPKFGEREIRGVKEMYPNNGTMEVLGAYEGTYLRAQAVFRDLILACPAYWMARSAGKKSFVGEYVIAPAKHASDVGWWNTVNPQTTASPPNLIYEGYAGAMASFLQTGDPNAHKLTNSSTLGVPESWSTGKEFVVGVQEADGSLGFGNVRVEMLDRRCAFWRSVSALVPV